MTRKCIICKSKNYKNASSFFSAPKDPKVRKLWQEVINIPDYVVNNDTYVCSKHFNKNDIITHWVSGVPPQVITIKYKKCRLRPGAVPNRIENTDSLDESLKNQQNSDNIIEVDEKCNLDFNSEDVDINLKFQKTNLNLEESYNCNLEDEIYEYKPKYSQLIQESKEIIEPVKKSKKPKLIESIVLNEEIGCKKEYPETNSSFNKLKDNSDKFGINRNKKISTYLSKKSVKIKKNILNVSQNFEMKSVSQLKLENCEIEPLEESLDATKIIPEENTIETFEELDNTNSSNAFEENSKCNNPILFENFLKVYNDISLPTNWFASVITKELTTIVMYFYMNITRMGIPYIEKQIFLSNDMLLRYAVLSKEINLSDFIREKEFSKINDLKEIEQQIIKFDQQQICPGMKVMDELKKQNLFGLNFEGDNLRHDECSMILEKNETVCSKCASQKIEIYNPTSEEI